MTTIEQTIMKRLEAQRIKKGIGITDFAKNYIHTDPKNYYNWRHNGCNLSHDELYNLSLKLGCSIDYLYGIDDQEERQVADVCKVTGLSAEAVKGLQLLNQRSKAHSWGNEEDHAYKSKGVIDLFSYIITHTRMQPFYYFLQNASAKAFFNTIPEDERAELIERFDLDYELGPAMQDYGKFLLTTAINNVLAEYEGQVPACIYAAAKKLTFGQAFNDFAIDYAESKKVDDDANLRYCEAYDHIRGIPTFETEKIKGRLQFVEKREPTAEDWALFKEMTGLTKEKLPGYKEGDTNEKR